MGGSLFVTGLCVTSPHRIARLKADGGYQAVDVVRVTPSTPNTEALRAPLVTGHGAGGPAPKRIVVGYGFWIFLLSDVIRGPCRRRSG